MDVSLRRRARAISAGPTHRGPGGPGGAGGPSKGRGGTRRASSLEASQAVPRRAWAASRPRPRSASPGRCWQRRRPPAEVYAKVCERFEKKPSPDIVCGLAEQGCLRADLQLCEEADAIPHFFREAPLGVRHIVLYDGLQFFGADGFYKERLRVIAQRSRPSVPTLADSRWRRSLAYALGAFAEKRGLGVESLELTGLQLGQQAHALSPLAYAVSGMTHLQRLHLAGCNLQDTGFSLLVPHLVRRLPRLTHLSIAANYLHDLHPIVAFLRARTRQQRKRAAAPLEILDLSQNPRLGAHTVRQRTARRRPPKPCGMAGGAAAPGVDSWAPTAPQFWASAPEEMREALLEAICDVLREGLVLRTLRLRCMSLSREDLRPLLQMLSLQVKQVKFGYVVRRPLEDVSLEGNPLEPEVPRAIAQALARIRKASAAAWPPELSELPGLPEEVPFDAAMAQAGGRGRRSEDLSQGPFFDAFPGEFDARAEAVRQEAEAARAEALHGRWRAVASAAAASRPMGMHGPCCFDEYGLEDDGYRDGPRGGFGRCGAPQWREAMEPSAFPAHGGGGRPRWPDRDALSDGDMAALTSEDDVDDMDRRATTLRLQAEYHALRA